MKKFALLTTLCLLLSPVMADDLPVFGNGKLNGSLKCKAAVKDGKLRFSTSDAPKLIIVPPTPDLSGYDQLEMDFSASRAGDKFRFTMTSNPEGADKWNYYHLPVQSIGAVGKQKLILPLNKVGKARQPMGKDKIQSMEINFTGWDMPFKKGLILEIDRIVLKSTGEVKKNAAASDKAAAAKKKILKRAAEQASLLPDTAFIPVPDISNRKFWDARQNTVFARNLLKHAERALNTPAVPPPTDYYLDFLRNGNRTRYEQAYTPVIQNYSNLTMALCITGNKEKYFKQWQAYNDVLCNMATWVYPAHDRKLDNLLMRRPHIELVGSNVAAIMATARQLLSPLLSKESAAAMEKSVHRQIITPFIETMQGKRAPDWFLASTNNWNAVCIANVVQTLLASDLPPDLRREAVAYALVHTVNFLKGFNPDGYCSEGISYWSYGFGHYLRLASLLYSASGGKVNMLNDGFVRKAAEFPEKFMLSYNNFFPAFADCYFNAGVGDAILYLRDYLLQKPVGDQSKIASNMLYQLAVWGLAPQSSAASGRRVPERISVFPETGVYLFRHPSAEGIRLACKGGSNDELHNHSDVGSYSIAFPGQVTILGDLGGSVYTRDSFSANRYKNPLLNSWGHPVPLPGKMLQSNGAGTESKVLRFERQPDHGIVVFDLRKAYKDVPWIKKIERTFRYDFADTGRITIGDAAEFESPQSFETALTTFGKVTPCGKNKLLAEYRNSAVEITVNSFGVPWQLRHETIKADTKWPDKPQRYAVELEGKHKNPRIEMIFTPVKK